MPPQTTEGRRFLVERNGTLLLCRPDGNDEVAVASVFDTHVEQRLGGVIAVRDGSDDAQLLPPEDLLVRRLYKQLSTGQVRFKMKIYICEWAYPAVWWEARLLAGPWGVAPAAFLKNMMRNHWRRRLEVVQSLGLPAHACLRKGLDRKQKQVNFWRCLPEHTLSTLGLLLVAAWRAQSSRGSGCRAQAVEFMAAFLDIFFANEACELALFLDPASAHRCTSAHPNSSIVVPMDCGRVYVQPFLAGIGQELRTRCLDIFLAEDPRRFGQCATVPIEDFLCAVFSLCLQWLVTQVFGQVSALADSMWGSKSFTECPYEIVEDSPSLPKHARRDVDLLQNLALGEGMKGSGKRAWQQGPFVRAYEMLTPAPKRQRTFSAQELNSSLMLDLLQAGQGIFASARHVSIALDGTRLGNKAVTFLAAGAFCNSVFRIMWAPVMVLWG